LEQIVSIHHERVLALLTRLLGDPHAARDAAQETWCAIWRAKERLIPGVDPWPFIRTTAVRKAIDLRRTLGRVVPSDASLDTRSAPPLAATSLALDLSALNEDERAAITLFFVDGWSIREIATALDAAEGTVKSWLFRARAKLRAQIGRAGGSS
jgi:RNA polymerase sigma-70 factor, ECF subfamily